VAGLRHRRSPVVHDYKPTLLARFPEFRSAR
jgi:hypothetical protein